MLSENIKQFRLQRGIKQEELAIRIHVVRQTVSKWENGLSVPDADQLIRLASELKVSVNDLLGVTIDEPYEVSQIAEKLANANQEIAHLTEEKRIQSETNRVRGSIVLLSVFALLASVLVKNEWITIIVSAASIVAAMMIFYRHLELLSRSLKPQADTKLVRIITIFDLSLFVVTMLSAVLLRVGVIRLSDHQGEVFTGLLIGAVMIVIGTIAPKLPHNRHTGLRLPWTVQDEETWNIAHKCLGIISAPLGIIYVGLSLITSHFETITLVIVLLWIGIPGLLSLVYFKRKYKS